MKLNFKRKNIIERKKEKKQDKEKELQNGEKQEKIHENKVVNNLVYSDKNIEKVNLDMRTFVSHLPTNGGYFIKKSGTKIPFINTCTIVNYLFGLWVVSKLILNFNTRFLNLKPETNTTILEIIQNIDEFNWDYARQLWYTKIMKMNLEKRKNRVNFLERWKTFF